MKRKILGPVLALTCVLTTVEAAEAQNILERIFGGGRKARQQREYERQRQEELYRQQQEALWRQEQQRRAQLERQERQRRAQPQPGAPLDLTPPGVIERRPLPPIQARPQPQTPTPAGPEPEEGKLDRAAYEEFAKQPILDIPMLIAQPEWLPEHEIQFANFVKSVGQAVRAKKCRSVKSCMRDRSVNPYAGSDPQGLILYSDCADFPYFMRAYFAHKNGLPFSYASGIALNTTPVTSPADRQDDLAVARLDNSPYGNIIQGRSGSNLVAAPGQEKNLIQYLNRMFDIVSTRTFRVGPMNPGAHLADIYPVKLDRKGIVPGTVVHTTGHLYMVFEVDASGGIHMVDAHPDGSISYKIIKPSTLDRSRPDHGLGFFKFRPQRLSGAQLINGFYYGGRIQIASNDELIRKGLYSLEQWYGAGSNVLPGQAVDPNQFKSAFKQVGFFDHLKLQLRDKNVIVPAEQEVRELMSALCTEMQQRMADVDKAIENGGPSQMHPAELPPNIFSTTGFWEDYSTPGRDSRLKSSVADIVKVSAQKFKQAKAGGFGLGFKGSAQDYQNTMRALLVETDRNCPLSYKKSNGATQQLKFSQVLARLNRLSFDPYHCPEKRWGASGDELSSCRDTDTGDHWYKGQAAMRNTVGKLTAGEKLVIRSTQPITLEMLRDPSLIDQPDHSPVNLGVSRAPIMNLDAYFASENFLKALTSP